MTASMALSRESPDVTPTSLWMHRLYLSTLIFLSGAHARTLSIRRLDHPFTCNLPPFSPSFFLYLFSILS